MDVRWTPVSRPWVERALLLGYEAPLPMTFVLALADVGWLTSKLLRVTLSSAEWVLWLLVALSVASLAVILERVVFFRSRRLQRAEEIAQRLARGELDGLRPLIEGQDALEARVLQQGLPVVPQGPAMVEEVVAATLAAE